MVDYLGSDGGGYGVTTDNAGDAAQTDASGAANGSGQAAGGGYEYSA